MKNYLQVIMIVCFTILMNGCNATPATPTPLPGWRSPVYQLLVQDSVFPEGWVVNSPQDTSTDPTANHIGRKWGSLTNGATAEQAIWRSYTIPDAEAKYDSLLKSQIQPNQTLPPETIFMEFTPPTEIPYRSEIADEFYLACGWWRWSYCEIVARYRNYVVNMRIDLKAEREGIHSDGLTHKQIEGIVIAMDTKFVEFLKALSIATEFP